MQESAAGHEGPQRRSLRTHHHGRYDHEEDHRGTLAAVALALSLSACGETAAAVPVPTATVTQAAATAGTYEALTKCREAIGRADDLQGVTLQVLHIAANGFTAAATQDTLLLDETTAKIQDLNPEVVSAKSAYEAAKAKCQP